MPRAERTAQWLRRNAVNIVVVLIVLVGGFVIDRNSRTADDKIYEAAITGCERGNMVRDALNETRQIAEERINILATDREIRALLSPSPELRRLDRLLARKLRRNAEKIEPLHNPDCRRVIPRP